MVKALFITYDGLTDTLGQSQILPYLIGLTKEGHKISILSCEKKDRYTKNRQIIENICTTHGINWIPLFFHQSPPIISKYYDLHQLTKKAFKLHNNLTFDIIHCRSYISAEIGLKMKKVFGTKFLFDMRSFWVDERIDGGLWDQNFLFYRIAYKKWKQKEAKMIQMADHIISLTEAGKTEINKWASYNGSPITVIPCSADMNLFSLTSSDQKLNAKKMLGIAQNTFVLSYLGSLGTWYLIDEMLTFFKELKERLQNAKFLILTPDDPQQIIEKAIQLGLKKQDFIIQFAQRKDVPVIMKASDMSISFIKPAYSKISSSPTKLGELLAMGIPVICNDIGDVSSIISKCNGGIILNDFSRNSMQKAIDQISNLESNPIEINRIEVEKYYNLDNAIRNYNEVYLSLKT